MNYLTNYYKNLSEQLQERVNHLQKLLEAQDMTPNHFDSPDAGNQASAEEVAMARHNELVDLVARHHAEVAPHIERNLGSHNYDVEMSKADLIKRYSGNNYKGKLFKSLDDALFGIASRGENLPPVIYPKKGSPHWGDRIDVGIEHQSGEQNPHVVDLVYDKIGASIEKELAAKEEAKKKNSGPLSHMFPGVMSSLEKLTNRKKQDRGMDEWAVQDGPQPH